MKLSPHPRNASPHPLPSPQGEGVTAVEVATAVAILGSFFMVKQALFFRRWFFQRNAFGEVRYKDLSDAIDCVLIFNKK